MDIGVAVDVPTGELLGVGFGEGTLVAVGAAGVGVAVKPVGDGAAVAVGWLKLGASGLSEAVSSGDVGPHPRPRLRHTKATTAKRLWAPKKAKSRPMALSLIQGDGQAILRRIYIVIAGLHLNVVGAGPHA